MSSSALATALQTVRDILAGDGTVSALVGSRIDDIQGMEALYPNIVLHGQRTPLNTLAGWGGIDHNLVTVTYWDQTYNGAALVALAGRKALEAAGLVIMDEQDEFEPLAGLSGLRAITQAVSFWA